MEHVHNTSKFLCEIPPIRNLCSKIPLACDSMLSLKNRAIKSQMTSCRIHAQAIISAPQEIIKRYRTFYPFEVYAQ